MRVDSKIQWSRLRQEGPDMIFQYFLRPLVGHYYNLMIDRSTRINWSSFAYTEGSPLYKLANEPTDGEAVAPQ